MDNTTNNTTGFKLFFGNKGDGASVKRFSLTLGGPNSLRFQTTKTDGSNSSKFVSGIGGSILETYTHFAIRIAEENGGTELRARVFVNGTNYVSSDAYPITHRFLPSNKVLGFGHTNGKIFASKSVTGEFDSIQIGDGVTLTDSQIAAIANHTDRNMTIATASAL